MKDPVTKSKRRDRVMGMRPSLSLTQRIATIGRRVVSGAEDVDGILAEHGSQRHAAAYRLGGGACNHKDMSQGHSQSEPPYQFRLQCTSSATNCNCDDGGRL